MKNAQQAILIAILAAACGCGGSDYDIPLPSSDLVVDLPRRVNDKSTGAVEGILFTISSDGTLSAAFDASSDTILEGGIADDRLSHTIRSSPKEPVVPIMFSKDNATLFCAFANDATKERRINFGLVSVNLETGVRKELTKVPGEWLAWSKNGGSSTKDLWAENYDYSLILGDRAALTCWGIVIAYDRPLGFDMFGNGWAVQAGKTVMIDRDGHVRRESRPRYLTASQTHVKGSMTLDIWTETEQHMDARADVGVVWLEDSRAVERNNRKNRAAVVYSGADIERAGFVPRHQSIFVLTGRGAFIVPYHTDPLAGTPQP